MLGTAVYHTCQVDVPHREHSVELFPLRHFRSFLRLHIVIMGKQHLQVASMYNTLTKHRADRNELNSLFKQRLEANSLLKGLKCSTDRMVLRRANVKHI